MIEINKMTHTKLNNSEGQYKTDWRLAGSGFALFFFSLILTMTAVNSEASHPTFGVMDASNGSPVLPLLIFGILLMFIAIPVAMNIFSKDKVWFVLFLLFSLPLIATSSHRILNVTLDNSDAESVVGSIVGKRILGSKNRTYLLQVARKNDQQIFEFAPTYKQYQTASVGDFISLEVHQGYFGRHWVSNYDIKMLGYSPHY